jgi:hypothetical protein
MERCVNVVLARSSVMDLSEGDARELLGWLNERLDVGPLEYTVSDVVAWLKNRPELMPSMMRELGGLVLKLHDTASRLKSESLIASNSMDKVRLTFDNFIPNDDGSVTMGTGDVEYIKGLLG